MLDRLTWGVGLISRVDSFFSHGITLEESGYYKGHDICRTHSSGNSNRVMGHDLQNKRKFHSCRIGNHSLVRVLICNKQSSKYKFVIELVRHLKHDLQLKKPPNLLDVSIKKTHSLYRLNNILKLDWELLIISVLSFGILHQQIWPPPLE